MLECSLWKEGYLINVKEIDAQHMYFVFLIDKVKKHIDSAQSKSAIKNLLHEIGLYARFHFFSEENLMREYSYPEIDRQIKEHEDLIDKLSATSSKLQLAMVGNYDADNWATMQEIYQFLVDWFESHTIVHDKSMGHFLNKVMETG